MGSEFEVFHPPFRKQRMKKPKPVHQSKSLEDVVLKFIERNNRRIWVAIALLAAVVVYNVN